MQISILDSASLGEDTPFSALKQLADVKIYSSTNPDEMYSHSENADVIIINKLKITEDFIKNHKTLKLICVFATGYDNIDIKAAKRYGVGVCNVPGYSTDSVVLFTVTTALALYSKIFEYNNFIKSGEYAASGLPNRLVPVFHEIKGKTWGIIGCGNIGRAVGKVAQALGANVIANTRSKNTEYENVDIDTLCKRSDIISIHCPLNSDSINLINKEKISLMKNDVILVNEARGAVLSDEDIVDAINSGRIAGFGADVYSKEPFGKEHPFYSIMNKSNVLLTPHAAWGAYEARERCVNIICENIKSYFSGGTKNRVDLL